MVTVTGPSWGFAARPEFFEKILKLKKISKSTK
jgi:hypothetical protein